MLPFPRAKLTAPNMGSTVKKPPHKTLSKKGALASLRPANTNTLDAKPNTHPPTCAHVETLLALLGVCATTNPTKHVIIAHRKYGRLLVFQNNTVSATNDPSTPYTVPDAPTSTTHGSPNTACVNVPPSALANQTATIRHVPTCISKGALMTQ